MKEQLSIMRLRAGAFAFFLFFCMLCALGLVACGGSSPPNTTHAGGNNQTVTNNSASAANATATVENKNHTSLAQLIGQPAAKLTRGVNFQVTGHVQNRDKVQHDIFLEATLKDANGRIVGIARGLADNVQGGQMATYTLQGFLKQPTWAAISVSITKVSENVDGQGSD